jgi:beta-1,4-mannosyl-glycoprotein beta-1,4-N-acetylglucosaminyltransferase
LTRVSRIFDCFTFSTELDLLEFRLDHLSSVVHRFVLVEATRTFSGLAKPLHFEENRNRFSRHVNRINHVVVEDLPPPIPDRWAAERFQRDAILRGLGDADPEDIAIIADADEIPDPNMLEHLRLRPFDTAALSQRSCFWRANWELFDPWTAARACRVGALGTPSELRATIPALHLADAGSHFTYLEEALSVGQKYASFSHAELDRPRHRSETHIFNMRSLGIVPHTGESVIVRSPESLNPTQRALLATAPRYFDFDSPEGARQQLGRFWRRARTSDWLPKQWVDGGDRALKRVIEHVPLGKPTRSSPGRPRSPEVDFMQAGKAAHLAGDREIVPESLADKVGVIILAYRDSRLATQQADLLVNEGFSASQIAIIISAASCPSPPRTDYQIWSSDVNLGYSAGMNRGLEYAEAHNWQVTVLLTHDACISRTALLELSAAIIQEPGLALIGPVLFSPEGDFFSGGGGFHRGGAFHFGTYDFGLHDVDWLDGAVLVGRTGALIEIGGFDDRFFLYGEDVDLGLRLRSSGWRVAVSGDHRASQRAGGQDPERRRVTAYLSTRNMLETYRKYGGQKSALDLALRQLHRVVVGPEPASEKRACLRGMASYALRRFGPPPMRLSAGSGVVVT